MKWPLIALIASFLLPAAASAQPANRVETDHLYIEWVEGTRPDLIDAARSEGERFYAAIAGMLGHAPAKKIIVVLQGPSEQADGRREAPRVDPFGRILLYSFDPSGFSYFSALAHEMVHAFRFDRRYGADWFFEEGLAEMVALRVDSSLAGFPWFDVAVDVVAGQWIALGEDIPLAVLRDRHDELNMSCRAQSYGLRSSFFDYLGRTYGDGTVVAMANREKAGALADYAQFFGKDFATLVAEWREALMASYRATDGAEDAARRYRTESPIQYIPVCKAGEQF